MTRLRTRRDKNEHEIVSALKSVGCDVVHLDFPCDLLVGFRGVNHLLEVKTETGKLRKNQEAFAADWRGKAVTVVRSVDDAFLALGLLSGE